MLYEKKKILIHRLVWFGLLLVGIAAALIVAFTISLQSSDLWIMLVIIFDSVIIAFFIVSLLLSCKVYDYNGSEIIVYAGFYHRYIKADGVIMDEHNTLLTYTAISLSCSLDDGTYLEARITLTNRISLKINNRLYTNMK